MLVAFASSGTLVPALRTLAHHVISRYVSSHAITTATETGQAALSEWISAHGWPAFRQKEEELLRAVGERWPARIVVSTGGCILGHANYRECRSAVIVFV